MRDESPKRDDNESHHSVKVPGSLSSSQWCNVLETRLSGFARTTSSPFEASRELQFGLEVQEQQVQRHENLNVECSIVKLLR
jgi:hypothetical protein